MTDDDLFPCACDSEDCTGLARWVHAGPQQHLVVDGVTLRDVPVRELARRERGEQ